MQAYELLECRFADWIRRDPSLVVACSSGTSALHLALEALEIPGQRRVVVPEFTMIACARAVVLAGLEPWFMDCDESLLLDIQKLSLGVRPSDLSAIMAVHIYGRRCPMESIARYADALNLYVIEDLAEAHGVDPHPRTDAACWSFYKNKIVAGEEGGIVAFRQVKHAALARRLRNMGHPAEHDFRHAPRCHNYRLANALAALILPSLDRVCENLSARRRVEAWYDRQIPDEWRMPPREVPWVYDFRVRGMKQVKQDCLVKSLNEQGVAARHGFKPMSSQREFRNGRGYRHLNAYRLSQEIGYLPLTPDMTERDVIANVVALRGTYAETP